MAFFRTHVRAQTPTQSLQQSHQSRGNCIPPAMTMVAVVLATFASSLRGNFRQERLREVPESVPASFTAAAVGLCLGVK